ncbi:MAG: ABC transporter substrate-binding protein [Sciscionella sp.]
MPAPGPQGPPNSITIAQAVEPASLDPLAGYAPDGASKLFAGLVAHDATGALVADLAAALPVPSGDGLTWTVHLRTGLTFSDGSALSSADVVATYRALLDPAVHSPLRTEFTMLRAVSAPDPRTVRFALTHPFPSFPTRLVLGILPAAALATPTPAATDALGEHPIGAGPYRLLRWRHGSTMMLVANPHYHGRKPALHTVRIRFVPSDAQRRKLIAEGKVDAAALPPKQAKASAAAASYDERTDPAADWLGVAFGATNPVTSNPAIRLALNLAVRRKAMLASVLGGAGSVADTPITDATPEFLDAGAHFTPDLARARGLLAAAGWRIGGHGIRARHGTRAAFTVRYPAGDTVAQALARQVSAAALAVGIAITARAGSGTLAPGEAALVSAGDPFDPAPQAGLLTGGVDPTTRYTGGDPTLASALRSAGTTPDPAQRAVYYRAYQRAYLKDPTMLVLLRTDHTWLVRSGWQNYTQVTDGAAQDVTWGALANLQWWTR